MILSLLTWDQAFQTLINNTLVKAVLLLLLVVVGPMIVLCVEDLAQALGVEVADQRVGRSLPHLHHQHKRPLQLQEGNRHHPRHTQDPMLLLALVPIAALDQAHDQRVQLAAVARMVVIATFHLLPLQVALRLGAMVAAMNRIFNPRV